MGTRTEQQNIMQFGVACTSPKGSFTLVSIMLGFLHLYRIRAGRYLTTAWRTVRTSLTRYATVVFIEHIPQTAQQNRFSNFESHVELSSLTEGSAQPLSALNTAR